MTKWDRMCSRAFAGSLCIALGACARPSQMVETVHDPVKVPVAAPCPSPGDYARIMKDRPKPLVQSAMPASLQVRVNRALAQLGRYEAPGGWSDEAVAALVRCQSPP